MIRPTFRRRSSEPGPKRCASISRRWSWRHVSTSNSTYTFWTFNGAVPGPFVRVRVGDHVEVHLKNNENSSMMHNVDFHAVTGPGGGAGATIGGPGRGEGLHLQGAQPRPLRLSLRSAAGGPAHRQRHVRADPRRARRRAAPVDHEFYVMQGEIYTEEPFGTAGLLTESYDKLLNERPEYFVFNGQVGALTEHYPLKAKVGETVRIFFGVGGPNLTSCFHVIGEIFDRAYNWAR